MQLAAGRMPKDIPVYLPHRIDMGKEPGQGGARAGGIDGFQGMTLFGLY